MYKDSETGLKKLMIGNDGSLQEVKDNQGNLSQAFQSFTLSDGTVINQARKVSNDSTYSSSKSSDFEYSN